MRPRRRSGLDAMGGRAPRDRAAWLAAKRLAGMAVLGILADAAYLAIVFPDPSVSVTTAPRVAIFGVVMVTAIVIVAWATMSSLDGILVPVGMAPAMDHPLAGRGTPTGSR